MPALMHHCFHWAIGSKRCHSSVPMWRSSALESAPIDAIDRGSPEETKVDQLESFVFLQGTRFGLAMEIPEPGQGVETLTTMMTRRGTRGVAALFEGAAGRARRATFGSAFPARRAWAPESSASLVSNALESYGPLAIRADGRAQ